MRPQEPGQGPLPQYLHYRSQHNHACKRAIFSGETVRHLVNCTYEADYDVRIDEVQRALRARGYPNTLLQKVPHDAQKRREYLNKYRQRRPYNNDDRPNVLTLKVKFSEQQRSLNLRRQADDLIKDLRADVGEHFLHGVRVVMAYSVHNSAFISSYACNFLRAGGRGPHTRRT